MMLVCAALAWQVSGRAWRRWKMERHIARLQREIDAVVGAAASRKAGGAGERKGLKTRAASDNRQGAR
jgi:hypothetical protein